MSNKIITIWLILLTAYCVMNELRVGYNVEARKKQFDSRKEVFENHNARFEKIEKYINEEINTRIDQIGKYTHEH